MSSQSIRLQQIIARGFASVAAGMGSLLVTAALVWGADPVGPAAEGFKTIPPNKTLSTDTKKRLEIEGLVRRIINGAPLTGNETIFDGYYASYLFPQWTQTTEEDLKALPKERDKFIKNSMELAGAKNPTAHSRLLDLSHTKLAEVAQDPAFHPAVRYNAILTVGLLNEAEPNRGTGIKQMPEPYIKALVTLLEELKKPGNNEAVRVGALLGVTRHLEWDNSKPVGSGKRIPPAMRNDAIAELTSIVNAKVPPAGRSMEGQTWLRRRALEALGQAYALKVEPDFAKLLSSIIGDDAEPISLRCTAADVMAHVEYPAAALPPISPMAKELGYLALFACNSELLRLEDLKKYDERLLRISGGGGGGGGGLPGGMPGGMSGPGGGGKLGGMSGPGGGMPGIVGGAMPGESGGALGGMMPGKSGGMPGGGASEKGSKNVSSDPKQYRIDYSKRRLRVELYAVQLALGRKKDPTAKGLLAYTKAQADTDMLDTITKHVEDIIRVVEEQDQSADDYDKGLRREMRKLETLTRPLPIAPKPGIAKADATKGPAAPGEEVPMETKPATEEPVEEIPTAPAAKGPADAGKGGAAPPAAEKGAPPPAEAGK